MAEEKTTSIVKIEEMSLEETQLTEQLYNNAGLDPVVDAGLKDYDKRIELENKLINKVFGPRGYDIRGYGESVAKRVAFAVYSLLNRQYGGKVGDLRSYILALEDERDRANTRYDELMGRVIGILGEEYKDLRTDSKVFMEKITTLLGEDIKESKIDQQALAERLADIDGLRLQIINIDKEKEQLKERHESQIAELKNEHKEAVSNLKSQIDTSTKEREKQKERHEAQLAELKSEHKETAGSLKAQIDALVKEKEQQKEAYEAQIVERDAKIEGAESEKTALASDLKQLRKDHNELKTAVTTLAEAAPGEEIGKKLGEDLYAFLLKDSKVPDMVIDGVGKFIDFKKYMGVAVDRGVTEVCNRIEKILGKKATGNRKPG
jgi:hypothetical protein